MKPSILAHGQGCALLTTATGACASLLAARGVDAPTAQTAFVYAALALWGGRDVVAGWRAKASASERLRGVGAWLALAICDVEANYLVVRAFQLTSLTSIMLLDCFTIPCVMVRRGRAEIVVGSIVCAASIRATGS